VRYDHHTRRQAKIRSLETIGMALVAFLVLILVFAFSTLETYAELPIPHQIQELLGLSNTGEFSSKQSLRISAALERNMIAAHVPPNSDMWTLEISPEKHEERAKDVANLFKREKLVSLSLEAPTPLATLRETLAPHTQSTSDRKALVLLPGETIRFSASAFSAQNPRIVVRNIAVTPDRKDSAAQLDFQVGEAPHSQIAVSPRGEIAAFTVTRANNTDPLSLHWPQNAPGALAILGEVSLHNKNLPGIILVTIDNLNTGLDALPRTKNVLKSKGEPAGLLFPFWPTSTNSKEAVAGIFTGKIPSNLGLTAPYSLFTKNKSFAKPPTLERIMEEKGYKTVRIQVGSSAQCANCSTSQSISSLLSLSEFSLNIKLPREHELRQGVRSLFQIFDGNLSDMFLHLDINMAAENLSHTWESALSEEGSVLKWLTSAWFGEADSVLQREKEIQIDQALSALFEKVKSETGQRIIVVTTQTQKSSPQTKGIPALPGEAWVPQSFLVSSPVEFASQASLFSAIASPENAAIKNEDIVPIQTSREEIFVTPAGWISLPLGLSAKTNGETSFMRSHVPFQKLEQVQSAIQKYREKYTLQSVHVLVPNIQAAMLFKGEIALPAKIYACESTHPDPSFTMAITGERENLLQFSIQPNASLTEWQLSCLIEGHVNANATSNTPDTATLKFSNNNVPVSPQNIALGEFALSAQSFSWNATLGQVLVSQASVFLPAHISPEFRAPFTKSVYFWMERYPAIPQSREKKS
jgi:hypothetical protein